MKLIVSSNVIANHNVNLEQFCLHGLLCWTGSAKFTKIDRRDYEKIESRFKNKDFTIHEVKL